MTGVVLDASAVLALLKGERGASKVAGVIADASVSTINQAEIISHYVHLGAPVDEIRTMLGGLPYAVVPADEALGWEAGSLRQVTAAAGLSLGGSLLLGARKAARCCGAYRRQGLAGRRRRRWGQGRHDPLS